MKQWNCRPPSGATGPNISVPWIKTSLSGTQTTHHLSDHSPKLILKTYSWRHVTHMQFLGHLFEESLQQKVVQSKTAPQLGMSNYSTLFYKNIQTILRSGNSQRPSCHSRAVSKQSSNLPIFSVICGGNKGRSVCDCTWGVAVRGRRNNICGFSFALRWLNDDMGPFLLPYKVTF